MRKIICGIYCITNTINGKKYVGQSSNILNRWTNHLWYGKVDHVTDNNKNGFSSIVHSAFRKYGVKNFSFSILETCTEHELDDRERYWISTLKTITPNVYNIRDGGGRCINTNKQNHQKLCPCCNTPITIHATMCTRCTYVSRRKKFDSKHEIIHIGKKLIEHVPFEEVSKSYGFGCSAMLRKLLRRDGLPTRKKKIIEFFIKETGYVPDEPLVENGIKKKRYRAVDKFDTSGNLLERYESIRDAAKANSMHPNLIFKCLNGTLKTSHGFQWRYSEE